MQASDGPPGRPRTLQSLAVDLSLGGGRAALVHFERGSARSWDFAELAEAVDRRARWLAGKGVRADEPVIVCGPNGADWIVAFLALMRCGACAVPVDAQFPVETFDHVLRDSGARLVLAAGSADERFSASCEKAGATLESLAGERNEKTGPDRAGGPAATFATVGPDDRAVLFYTSGTTGPPKGVPLTHGNIAYQVHVLGDARLVVPGDRILVPLPLHHVYPLVVGALAPLALRVTVILPEAFTGTKIAEALRKGEASFMIGVPRLYDALIDGIEDRVARRGRPARLLYRCLLIMLRGYRRRFSRSAGKTLLAPLHRRMGRSLRVVVCGGAALKPDTAWTLEALGWRVGTGYGLTETSPLLTMITPGEDRFETAGRPVRGVELRIDRGAKNEQTGEVLARGPGVFAGYHNLDDKTEEAFTDDGWFRTGDLGRIDESGYLHLTGRKSTLIVTAGGENVQPDRIEEAYGAHPAIAEIAVFGREGRIVGLIVADPAQRRAGDAEDAVEAAVREVSSGLPSYMRLAEHRVTREAIPRTRLGKPRRHLIEDRYRVAGEEGRAGERPPEEPLNFDELSDSDRALLESDTARAAFELMAARYSGRRVTPDSDLQADLGIDSIEWLDLSLEISERTGVNLSEDAITETRTVRDLLERVAAGEADGVSLETVLDDPEAALEESQRRWLSPPGRVARALARALAALNGIVMRWAFRLRVSGLGHVGDERPVVFAPNHASYLDPFVLAAALGTARLETLYWAGWTGVAFRGPLRRAVARLARVLPIDPIGGAASSLAFGGAALKRGSRLVWFPEGRRSPDGDLQPFRLGLGLVLRHWPAPVVPVVIRGTHDAWPPSRRWPRLRPVSVEFLPPADPADLAKEGRGEDEAERIVDGLHRRLAMALREADH